MSYILVISAVISIAGGDVGNVTSHSAAVEFAAAGNLFHTKEDAEAAALARREAK